MLNYRKCSRRFVAIASIASIAAVTGASQASADHRGDLLALNSSTWRVCASGLVAGQNATGHAIRQVNRSQVSAYLVPCSGTYNVTSISSSYPDNWFGYANCSNVVSSTKCSLYRVRLNSRTINTTSQWEKTACHEFGHVGSLGHRYTNNSCVTQGEAPPIDGTFDGHDLDSLNATY